MLVSSQCWHSLKGRCQKIAVPMTRTTTIGIILAVLGVIAQALDCPYGIHMIIAGAVVAVIGFFVRSSHSTSTTTRV